MNQTEFRQEYLCEWVVDEEYQPLLDLWIEYRKQTHDLPASMGREALKIHKSLFDAVPKDKNYQQAKIESLRIIEHT
jgi:hypothetical protein